jgi:hypothetical protein
MNRTRCLCGEQSYGEELLACPGRRCPLLLRRRRPRPGSSTTTGAKTHTMFSYESLYDNLYDSLYDLRATASLYGSP